MPRSTAGPALLLLALLVAGCGGATTPDSVGGLGSPSSAGAPAPTDTPTQTDTSAASEGAGGGGGGAGVTGAAVCELATSDELTGVFGVPVTTLYDPNAPTTCFVRTAEGRTLVHWTTTGDGPMMFEALSAGSTPVAGLGDQAAHIENFGLMIVKGDTAVTIVVPGEADLDADAAREASEGVAAFIAGRM